MKKFLKSLTIATAAAMTILAASSPVKAVVVNWTLNDVAFSDGGIATGGFQTTFNDDETFIPFPLDGSSPINKLDIFVSSGDENNFRNFRYQVSDIDWFDKSKLDLDANPRDSGLSNFDLFFDPALTSRGGTFSISGSELYTNEQGEVLLRSITAGTLTGEPVPEPLTIMGTFLAGGMGIAIKKKRAKKNLESV
jgi:hypothetical protein